MGYVGSRVRRLEDPRLLAGAGHFADDEERPGQLWMRVVRSPVAHAALGGVPGAAAQVELDPGTGGIEVLRYFVAYEVGRAINPATVEGQLGAKGAGEGGITAAGAAIASAVGDALGVPRAPARLPIAPERVCQLVAAFSGVSAARQAVRPG